MKKRKLLIPILLLVLIVTACSKPASENSTPKTEETKQEDTTTTTAPEELPATEETVFPFEVLKGKEFTIVAKEASWQINEDTTLPVFAYNGTVPGSQIRVVQGETIKIHLKNELSEPTAIHWHGIPVPNEMDGIPGVTQNAVQSGETFTYEFTATHPGTYMYHTHQDAVIQMDRGLYGSLIVEPKEKTYDRDYTIMLDEWMSNAEDATTMSENMAEMDHGNMSGMDHGTSGETMGHDMSIYDIFTMNGKSGKSIEPLIVKEGENVRIRFANVGFLSHNIHLHGHNFKVVAIDGQELNEPTDLTDELISVGPGERYDIEFIADNPGQWYLECHGDMEGIAGMKALIQYAGNSESKDQSNQNASLPVFNFTSYGSSEKTEFTLDQKYDVEYTMDLNGDNMNNIWTINGKSFPNIDGLKVKEGDTIKVKLINNSPVGVDHPMHLHGHFFQVLSKNGQSLTGSPIVKDTINLKPGDEYEVAFKADNSGNWLFHCHDLHHATAGMVDLVLYEGYQPNFTPDPNANNKPE